MENPKCGGRLPPFIHCAHSYLNYSLAKLSITRCISHEAHLCLSVRWLNPQLVVCLIRTLPNLNYLCTCKWTSHDIHRWRCMQLKAKFFSVFLKKFFFILISSRFFINVAEGYLCISLVFYPIINVWYIFIL